MLPLYFQKHASTLVYFFSVYVMRADGLAHALLYAMFAKIKYLGVLLDNSLNWKDQVQAVSLKVPGGLGILKHAKNFLPFSALTNLSLSIVEPHF